MSTVSLLVSGGIGCGKSYVIQVFNALGIPSYDADSRAKRLYDTDPALLRAVAEVAGGDVLCDGALDRRMLASRIFGSPDIKRGVEALVHPAVMRDFALWRDGQRSSVVIMESAVLLEHPELLADIDFSAVVTAPMEVRMERVASRDGASREQIMARIAGQWSDADRVAAADFVIENDGTRPILPQIIVILDRIFPSGDWYEMNK